MQHKSRNLQSRTITPRTWTASFAILWLCVFPAFVLSVTCKAEASCCRRLPARDHPGFCWDLQDAFFLCDWTGRKWVLPSAMQKTSSDEITLASGIHITHERLIISTHLCIIVETEAFFLVVFYLVMQNGVLWFVLFSFCFFWCGGSGLTGLVLVRKVRLSEENICTFTLFIMLFPSTK